MNKGMIVTAVLCSLTSFAQTEPVALHVGESFTNAREKLYVNGWRADPLAHVATGEYMGLDRQLVQNGYFEVDYCSVGKALCVLQYTKGKECLRLHTQGEQIHSMKVEHWSSDCRERGVREGEDILPADVRYIDQWRRDCEDFGQCKGIEDSLRKLKKKYARDTKVMKVLGSYDNPVEFNRSPPK